MGYIMVTDLMAMSQVVEGGNKRLWLPKEILEKLLN